MTTCKNCSQLLNVGDARCPKCGAFAAPTYSKQLWVIVGLAVVLGVAVLWQNIPAPAKTPSVAQDGLSAGGAATDAHRESPTAPEPKPEPPRTLVEAIEFFKPAMSDEMNRPSPGASLLALWSVDGLLWGELKKLQSTTRARVMKDPDEERGKLICVAGHMVEIAAEKVEANKLYVGGLADNNGGIYRFVNVGSSADLVEQSYATTCGVVIGRIDYSNSMGGTAHAVQLVGMFDLPENKVRKAPAGAGP